MSRLSQAALTILLIAGTAFSSAGADRPDNPLRFFEGRTESVSTVKTIIKKSFLSRSLGHGEIGSDGTLYLVQRVEEEGRPPFDRQWRIRQIAPSRYAGTMSEAKGPVVIDELEGRFRFRFKMKGNVSVEQWLTPLPGGKSATTRTAIRKFGLTIGSSDGIVRKL